MVSNTQVVQQSHEDAIEHAVVALLDLIVVWEGTEIVCRLCEAYGGDHTPECPVPALEERVNPREQPALTVL